MADKALDLMKVVGSLTGIIAILFGGVQLAIILPERVKAVEASQKVTQSQQAADHDLIMRQMGQFDVMNARLTTILGKLDHLEQLHMTNNKP